MISWLKARTLTSEDVLLVTRRKYGFAITDIYGKWRIFMEALTLNTVRHSRKMSGMPFILRRSLLFYARKIKNYPSYCNVRPLIQHIKECVLNVRRNIIVLPLSCIFKIIFRKVISQLHGDLDFQIIIFRAKNRLFSG